MTGKCSTSTHIDERPTPTNSDERQTVMKTSSSVGVTFRLSPALTVPGTAASLPDLWEGKGRFVNQQLNTVWQSRLPIA